MAWWERQALQIKNLESIICCLNRQNEEAATDLEWERLSAQNDKDTVKRQALQIKNLESIIYHLNRQNEESAEELELLRLRAKKDEATILRRARRLQTLDSAISKLNIQKKAFLSKIQCLNSDVKVLEASRKAQATDLKNLMEKIEQQNQLICKLNTENVVLLKKVDHLQSCNKSLQKSLVCEVGKTPRFNNSDTGLQEKNNLELERQCIADDGTCMTYKTSICSGPDIDQTPCSFLDRPSPYNHRIQGKRPRHNNRS